MNKQNNIFNLIVSFVALALVAVVTTKPAFAECSTSYGGGRTCTYESRFKIRKFVKLEGDNSWKDEVLVDLDDDDENDKEILFKVEVSVDVNSDDVNIDHINFDDMKMKDSLPDELKYLSESEDELTEEWDDFEPGETKVFYFTTKIEGDEKVREGSFEKCVINTAKLYHEDNFVDDDDAVVCYKKGGDVLGTSTELPETGTPAIVGISGLLSLALGTVLKLKKSR